ncbi:transcriptional regulator, LacI family [Actinopolyspora mzabensis]|uniref:Transcriptional regulator, LacI family n=1 Tax=Actinopolyspora mzabensis TaxID=995066 RepID=A0A1G9EH50_ACTMZ|nr:LacI family DNA-binding transcriptional regulator [Actinopolyspora mzabensis]SDK75381.1 transcriptional regulator, LacI family [Actinopolyspora mzabensis]
MHRETTLEEVAERAGVSRQTVSNALNAPHKLHERTLGHVREVIAELGYRPDARARGLRTNTSSLIGYCLPSDDVAGSVNAVMDQYLHALSVAIERTGRHLLLFTRATHGSELEVYRELLAAHSVDGFLLSDIRTHDPRPQWLAERAVPFVSFGRTGDEQQRGPWVDVDGAAGADQAVRHLVHGGHTRIGFLGLPAGNRVGDDRARGWLRACAAAGLGDCERMLVHCADEHHDNGDSARRALALPESPTALVAANDALALGSYAACAERGLRIGEDIAVIGFDDSPTATKVHPALTSLRQPVEHIAQRLVARLDSAEPGGELYEPELVVRASSAP